MTDHNRHAMPFIMDLEPAVGLMVKAIRKRKKSLAFPWPLAALVWSMRILPRPAYDWVASKIDRRKAPEAGGPKEGGASPEGQELAPQGDRLSPGREGPRESGP
jgi:hypothetical protein